MIIDELKYNKLFLEKFQANKFQLENEFARVTNEHGYTEEVKLAFYQATFDTLIKYFKINLPKDKAYPSKITNFYDLFIKSLKQDGIDTTSNEADLDNFINIELHRAEAHIKSNFISEDRRYNLNTKYGRRKAREQAERNYQNGTPEYRQEIDNLRFIACLIIIVIIAVVYILLYSK
jgi:hypothetical protein